MTSTPNKTDAGEPTWLHYGFEYDWDGKTYEIDIPARSEQEARERLKRLPLARYVGVAYSEPKPLSLWAAITMPLTVWVLNFWRGRP